MALVMNGSSTDESGSEPLMPPDSPGSSVSSRMQEEYEELLKYAVVVPSFDPTGVPSALTDVRGSFNPLKTQVPINTNFSEEEHIEAVEGDGTLVDDEQGEEESIEESVPEDPRKSTPRDAPSPAAQVRQGMSGSLEDRLAARLFTEERPGTPESVASSEPASHVSHEMERDLVYSIGVDQDVTHMESMLDRWTYQLKKDIMDEFGRAKIKLIEQHRLQMQREKEKHASEINAYLNEVDSLKELLHTYEQSITRKDDVINNLTLGLQKQKEKQEKLKTFSDWKGQHNDAKREAFASKLANKHYERSLSLKCWDAWHSVVENKWKNRVEKACQAKAQEVCLSLTGDYEAKIGSLNEALESSRVEVAKLHEERDRYEETMKKAFMRGVCALNLEAMSMFHDSEKQDAPGSGDIGSDPRLAQSEASGQHLSEEERGFHTYSTTISQEPVYTTQVTGHHPGAPPQARVVAARPSHGHSKSGVSSKSKAGKGKQISARVSARGGPAMGSSLGGGSLAPPMSSVVVERHQPVVKQTIGQATASRYPARGGQGQPGIVQRKIAGQTGGIPLVSPNIQTVKVVD